MGALTVAGIAGVVVSRCRKLMSYAGLNTTATTTPNPDLNDPIASALERLGVAPGNRAAVVDGDLAVIGPGLMQSRFLDLVEIFTIETCQTNVLASPVSQSWDDYKVSRQGLLDAIEKLIANKWDRYRRLYLQGQAPAVGQMTAKTEHPLDTSFYWPTN